MAKKYKAVTCIVLVHIVFILISCTSVEFVKTGEEYPALNETDEVQVLLTIDKNQYDEIGIADIGGVSLPVRIEKAKQIARSKGGNVIVPVTMCTEEAQKRMRSGYIIQSFYILKTKTEAIAPKEAIESKQITPPVEEEFIPEKQAATFQQLLQHYPSLQGQPFTNTMVPLRFYKIPPSLLVYGLSDYKLCLMQFDTDNTVLVFIPKEKITVIKNSIDTRSTIAIDFTPLGVYKGKYPVLKMLSE
ncbi:MAG: hypothetical protein QHH74_01895 [Spirochaetota bacterium]|nr:hypothetical protein [Spirochaetota bacterium]